MTTGRKVRGAVAVRSIAESRRRQKPSPTRNPSAPPPASVIAAGIADDRARRRQSATQRVPAPRATPSPRRRSAGFDPATELVMG